MAEPTKLCARCGLMRPRLEFFGRPWCDPCERAQAAERRTEEIWQVNKARYERRKAMGQCQRCSEPARPGMATCADCARKRNEARQAQVRSKATRRAARRRG